MKKIFKVIALYLVCFLVFASVVLFLFNRMQNNPVDKVAMTYIRHCDEIIEFVGEIKSIGRYGLFKVEKIENTIIVPYSVETQNSRVVIAVTLIENEETWEVISYEIRKVENRG